jgi:hypothetical protein
MVYALQSYQCSVGGLNPLSLGWSAGQLLAGLSSVTGYYRTGTSFPLQSP